MSDRPSDLDLSPTYRRTPTRTKKKKASRSSRLTCDSLQSLYDGSCDNLREDECPESERSLEVRPVKRQKRWVVSSYTMFQTGQNNRSCFNWMWCLVDVLNLAYSVKIGSAPGPGCVWPSFDLNLTWTDLKYEYEWTSGIYPPNLTILTISIKRCIAYNYKCSILISIVVV